MLGGKGIAQKLPPWVLGGLTAPVCCQEGPLSGQSLEEVWKPHLSPSEVGIIISESHLASQKKVVRIKYPFCGADTYM